MKLERKMRLGGRLDVMTRITSTIAVTAAALVVAAPVSAMTFDTIHVTSMSYDGPSSFPGITPDSLAAGTVAVPVDDVTNPHPSGRPAQNPFSAYGGVTNLTIDPSGTGTGFGAPIFGFVNGDPWVVTLDFTVNIQSFGTFDLFSSFPGGTATVQDHVNFIMSKSGNTGTGLRGDHVNSPTPGTDDPATWLRHEWDQYAYFGANQLTDSSGFTPLGDDPFGGFDYSALGFLGMDATVPCTGCTSGIFEDYTLSGGAYSDEPIGPGTLLTFDPGVTYSIRLSGSCSNCAPTGTIDFSIVPIPAAVWLFGSALLGLVGIRRRISAG